jgi:uroporphyrinogen decarboxylase
MNPVNPAASQSKAITGEGLTGRERILRACRGEPVDRVPIWLMRQAGRYLPEYRQVREQAGFETLVKTPDLATEVTLQPLRRFPLDAAILFSDIMMPAEAMGLGLRFDPGPVISPPLRSRRDIERLKVPEDGEGLEYIPETVARLRRELGDGTALFGFAGAPLTLATYMCEGKSVGGSGGKQFMALRRLLHSDPQLAHQLLERLARVITGSLLSQVKAGADVVQLFDTWAGLLDPVDFRTFGLPHVREIIDAVREKAPATPIVYFARGAGGMLEMMNETGADVIGLDWPLDLAAARRRLGPRSVQGNLDPVLLLASPELMAERARGILAAGGGRGHIFNLGHGVHLDTPPEQVARLVEVVHEFDPASVPASVKE